MIDCPILQTLIHILALSQRGASVLYANYYIANGQELRESLFSMWLLTRGWFSYHVTTHASTSTLLSIFSGALCEIALYCSGGCWCSDVDTRRIIRSKTVQIMFSLEIHAFKAKADSQRISLLNLAAQI